MERKLGIDWEHSEKQHLGSMDSLQTNDIEERNYKELKDSVKDSLISSAKNEAEFNYSAE
jgi:hypothetical protein